MAVQLTRNPERRAERVLGRPFPAPLPPPQLALKKTFQEKSLMMRLKILAAAVLRKMN
jgi:hypothetical protein